MSAVHSDLLFVQNGNGGQGCGCGCNGKGQTMVFRSVWDRLCQQLFGAIPPGMNTDDILPDITIWQNGVVLQDEEGGEFSFTVTTSDGEAPKPQDVILYKGKYYIVGEVDDPNQSGGQSAGVSDVGTDPHGQQAPGDDVVPSGVSDGGGSDASGEQASPDTGVQASEPIGDNTDPSAQEQDGNGGSADTPSQHYIDDSEGSMKERTN